MSKQGLFAPLHAYNQTLIRVNVQLPKENLNCVKCGPGLLRKPAGSPRPGTKNRPFADRKRAALILSGPWMDQARSARAVLRRRLVVGGRRRAAPVLGHEGVELFLILGVTQPGQEILELALLF